MTWWQFALLGAGGGLLVEVLAVFRWLGAWQVARRTKSGRVRGKPPRLRVYIDPAAHCWLAVCRAALGAATTALFAASGQINGIYVAVTLGFSAPAVLAQLGTVPQIAAAVAGSGEASLEPTASRDQGLVNPVMPSQAGAGVVRAQGEVSDEA
ncbi:hypothetical protein ACFY3E_41700 [Streptomyces griseorubiginosus]|uniref:hypothetical protein n=1 Tax=Streptomyces griseorubiginosus TaxID=67304 RepID=UPI00369A8F65